MSAQHDDLSLLDTFGDLRELPRPAREAREGIVTRTRAIGADLVELTKPRLTMLVLFTTSGGYLLAPGETSTWSLIVSVGAVFAVVAAAQSLNCWLERDVDALMHRTRGRALPAGRLPAWAALAQGLFLAAVSLPFTWLAVNPLSAALAAIALISYVAVYTPMKRRSSIATLVGALPGALPPLIGWTAARGRIELPGAVLFGVLFLWQIPHFLALSVRLEDDYRRGGLYVLPIDGGNVLTRASMVLWIAALVPVSLLVVPLGLAGSLYAAVAALSGAGFLALGVAGLSPRAGRRWATAMFVYSIVYLTVLFALLAIDGRG